MSEYARQLREIRESLKVRDSKFEVIRSMATYVFGAINTIAMGYILYILTSK